MKSFFLAAALVGMAGPAFAQASEPYLGEIIYVGFNFCPAGWSTTQGQLLPIAQNQALFALLGTTYGGDGKTTFALPNLKLIVSKTHAPLTACIALQGVFPSRN